MLANLSPHCIVVDTRRLVIRHLLACVCIHDMSSITLDSLVKRANGRRCCIGCVPTLYTMMSASSYHLYLHPANGTSSALQRWRMRSYSCMLQHCSQLLADTLTCGPTSASCVNSVKILELVSNHNQLFARQCCTSLYE
jgi:hypothetical protein